MAFISGPMLDISIFIEIDPEEPATGVVSDGDDDFSLPPERALKLGISMPLS